MSRIAGRFAALKKQGRAGLVTFVTAGDPDPATSAAILKGLAGAGADLIELGMPFSDPMADGPAIQVASQRALAAGATLASTLSLVRTLRETDDETPVILMGYYNPIYSMGAADFCAQAAKAGADGVIVVDLPPEEAEELAAPLREAGLDFIFLIAPTTGDERLSKIVSHAGGFVYYVSITGVTGTRSANAADVERALLRLRRHTDLPVAVGFGIRTADQVAEMAGIADAVVVGSAIVSRIAAGLDEKGRPGPGLVPDVFRFVSELASGLRKDS